MATGEQESLEIRAFEFDFRNSHHLERHSVDANLIYDVFAGRPLFFVNPPDDTRSGSHLMIGPATDGRFWTIVITMVDDDGIWRPITGWPSTGKEVSAWQGEAFQS